MKHFYLSGNLTPTCLPDLFCYYLRFEDIINVDYKLGKGILNHEVLQAYLHCEKKSFILNLLKLHI